MTTLTKPKANMTPSGVQPYLSKLVEELSYSLKHIDIENISGFLGQGLNTGTDSLFLGTTLICYGKVVASGAVVFPIEFKKTPAIITSPTQIITAGTTGFTVPAPATFDYIAIGRRNI